MRPSPSASMMPKALASASGTGMAATVSDAPLATCCSSIGVTSIR